MESSREKIYCSSCKFYDSHQPLERRCQATSREIEVPHPIYRQTKREGLVNEFVRNADNDCMFYRSRFLRRPEPSGSREIAETGPQMVAWVLFAIFAVVGAIVIATVVL